MGGVKDFFQGIGLGPSRNKTPSLGGSGASGQGDPALPDLQAPEPLLEIPVGPEEPLPELFAPEINPILPEAPAPEPAKASNFSELLRQRRALRFRVFDKFN